MPDTHRMAPIFPGGASKQGPHRVGAFATCPQLEGFGYEVKLRSLYEKPATAIGTLFHVGLAYRYAMMMPKDKQPSWLVYPDARTALWTCGQDKPEAALEALRLFDAYQANYTTNIWLPLLVEHQFEVEMEGEPYTARIDLLAVDCQTNEIVLIDHKSQAKLRAATATDYRADRQMLTGLALARSAGYDVRRVVINAASKEVPPRFGRFDVPISEIAYSRLGEDTRHVLRQMKDTRARHPDPMNRPRNWDCCVRKYGICEYWNLCTDGLQHIDEFVVKKD